VACKNGHLLVYSPEQKVCAWLKLCDFTVQEADERFVNANVEFNVKVRGASRQFCGALHVPYPSTSPEACSSLDGHLPAF